MSVNLLSENTTSLDQNIPHITRFDMPLISHKRPRWHIQLGAVLLILWVCLILNLSLMRYVVGGSSMLPTLVSGEQLLVNRWRYIWHPPQRGELVIVHLHGISEQPLVKRVIGLPGETVEFRAGLVYINGQRLPEPYLHADCDLAVCADSIWQLGADDYFVLGDNRHHSSDSRAFGAISLDHILGAVIWHAVFPPKLLNKSHQDWTQQ